jgi:aspartyl/asparaginyl beta-hydroxylase (cupin superfamily)
VTVASAPSAAALAAAADRAAKAGAVAEARRLLQEAAAMEPANLGLWMNLAACCRALGDLAEALAAVQQALTLDPRAFVPLLTRATLLERLGAPHGAGHAYGVALTQAPPPEQTPPQLAAAIAHAREVHARYQDELARALTGRLDAAGPRTGPAARRLDAFVGRLAGHRRAFHQEPAQFHYPGLPELEFHDREDFPWLAALEAATGDILAELTAILSEDAAGLEPYVDYPAGAPLDQWAELNRSPAWSSYHLWKDGERVEAHAARAPRTMAAIAQIPQPQVARRSPAAMFSVLKPHTRIPPHTGVANTRLVLHLPLIVPPGCGFRVGSETREWKVGEAWVFDDTIEHEAWNDSDLTRTILICDVWNPRLSEEERALIAEVMAAMDAFSGEAAAGDGL